MECLIITKENKLNSIEIYGLLVITEINLINNKELKKLLIKSTYFELFRGFLGYRIGGHISYRYEII
jgi:hypothetical protein